MNIAELNSSPAATFGYYSKLPCEKRNTVPKHESYFYILESESSQGSDDGSETVLSVQEKETDLAKDTSDTDWSIDGSDVEYELVSSSEERVEDLQSQVVDENITSDTDNDILTAAVISITVLDNGDIVSADSEESVNGTASGSEAHLSNYIKCVQCQNNNNNPKFRYCEKCFKLRKDFFPPRPKPKRKSNKNKKQGRMTRFTDNKISDNVSPSELNFKDIVVPASIKGESSDINHDANSSKTVATPSANVLNNPDMFCSQSYDYSVSDCGLNECDVKNATCRKRKTEFEDGLDVKRMNTNENNIIISKNYNTESFESIKVSAVSDTTSFSQPIFSEMDISPLSKSFSDPGPPFSKDDIDLNSHNFSDVDNHISIVKSESSSSSISEPMKIGTTDPNMCITCLVNPKSGVFVHGRIAHICCCYKCSVKIWTKTKRCPICKCKVNNVLRAFFG